MKIRCLLIDDEPIAQQVLEEYAGRTDMLEIVGRYRSAVAAFPILQTQSVDLLFLDIEMPQLSGLDLLRILPQPPKVIITSAYREYALDGYEFNVLDYLVKPVSFDRFMKAVGKFMQATLPTSTHVTPIVEEEPFLFVKEDRKLIKIFLRDILYLESLRDYVRLTTSTRQITTRHTIGYYEELLPSHQFVRIHRSFMIGISHIESISESQIAIAGQPLPIGGNYKSLVFQKLNIRDFIR